MIYFQSKDGKKVIIFESSDLERLKAGDLLANQDGSVLLAAANNIEMLRTKLLAAFNRPDRSMEISEFTEMLKEAQAPATPAAEK